MSRAISLPFEFDIRGGIAYSEDPKKIWQDRVVIVVMTLLNERVMQPGFGTRTRAQVLENIPTAAENIRAEIEVGFTKWLSPLTLTDVILREDDKLTGTLYVEVEYNYGTVDSQNTVVIKTDLLSSSGDVVVGAKNG